MKKLVCYAFLSIYLSLSGYTQKIKSMEFHNQDISDILLVLAESTGVSIISDETVKGKASFYFYESTIDDALKSFLSTYKCFYEQDGNVIKVSKIKTAYNKDSDCLSIKADEICLDSVFRRISSVIGKTVLFDSVPDTYISLDVNQIPVDQVIQICIKKFPEYSLEVGDNYYYVKKESLLRDEVKNKKRGINISKNDELYSLNLDKGRFLEVLTNLFSIAGKEYSIFVQSDVQLENLYFQNKDFYTILRLILEHGNADYVEKNGVVYIIDLQRKGISTKLKNTEIIQLKWINAQDILSLIPNEYSASSNIKIDKNNNSLLLTGTDDEILMLKKIISNIDVKGHGIGYKTFELKYLDAKDAISLIPEKMVQGQVLQIPNSNNLLVWGSEEVLTEFERFINEVDVKKIGSPVKLKYIKADALLEKIPPSISKDLLIDSGYPNLLFFKGSEANKKLFLSELALIDKPQPQIKYQLLVVQYSKGNSTYLKPTISARSSEYSGASTLISDSTTDSSNVTQSVLFNGVLSNLMTLNFDIISNFGYQFAVNLNSQIGNNTANIFTDTTLTAISGQEINFQNTDTYRYLEYEYDTSTGTSIKRGVTQQITSGLLVTLNGWVSGDNMITMNVKATISKQNNDSSGSSVSSSSSLTTLPSTSERVVTTQVRTVSGEPVVLSGLIKESDSYTENKIFLLGDIPLIGNLFKQKAKTKEKTEIVIYIIPHLIQEINPEDDDVLNLQRYYNNLVSKKW